MSKRFEIAFEEVQEPIDNRTEQEIEEEHQRMALEIDEDSRELEYQSDLVEGLESLRLIADQLDKPSCIDIALFKVAANMAVIGTKQSAQDFLPAMESNKPIALEGFGEKIKEILEKIWNFIKSIANKLKDYLEDLFLNYSKVLKNIEELSKKDSKQINFVDSPSLHRLKRLVRFPEDKQNIELSFTEIDSTLHNFSIYINDFYDYCKHMSTYYNVVNNHFNDIFKGNENISNVELAWKVFKEESSTLNTKYFDQEQNRLKLYKLPLNFSLEMINTENSTDYYKGSIFKFSNEPSFDISKLTINVVDSGLGNKVCENYFNAIKNIPWSDLKKLQKTIDIRIDSYIKHHKSANYLDSDRALVNKKISHYASEFLTQDQNLMKQRFFLLKSLVNMTNDLIKIIK